MEIAAGIRAEWLETHVLSRASLLWLHEHADPDDGNPIVTAIGLLRAESVAPVATLGLFVAGHDQHDAASTGQGAPADADEALAAGWAVRRQP